MKTASMEYVMNHPSEFSALFKLSPEKRLELAQALWDSIEEDGAELALPQWQLDELEARIARYKAGGTKLHSWDEVKQRLNRDT